MLPLHWFSSAIKTKRSISILMMFSQLNVEDILVMFFRTLSFLLSNFVSPFPRRQVFSSREGVTFSQFVVKYQLPLETDCRDHCILLLDYNY